MTFYKKLTLCSNPLSGDHIGQLMHEKALYIAKTKDQRLYEHLYASDEIDKYVSPLLLDQFRSLGLRPAILINFSEYGLTHKTWMHTDMTYHDNRWKPLELGINWELQPAETTFNWYEAHVPGKEPGSNEGAMTWPRVMINGVRYPDETQLTKIGSVTFDINTAYLVRTGIPHQIVSSTPGNFRECISVRFFYDDIPTWERALEIFEPYFA